MTIQTFTPFAPARCLLPLGLLLMPIAAVHAQSASDEKMLSEVSVSSTKSQSQELRRNASAGKIIYDRAELDALDAASMGELLGKLPGGGMFTDMEAGPRGRSRSPDRNMPQILVDGQPLPGGGRNPMAALRLPVELIERVEIIRNSTAEFPVLSPGGVINLILRDVPNKQTAGIKIGAGSTDGQSALRLEGQFGEPDGGDFGYLLAGSFNSRPMVGSQTMNGLTFNNGALQDTIQEKATQSGRDNNLTLSPRFSWNLGGGQRLNISPFLTHTETERNSTIDRTISGVNSTDRMSAEERRSTGRLMSEWKQLGAGGAATIARLMLQAERDRSDQQTNKLDGNGALASRQTQSTVRDEREGMLELRRKQLFGDSHLLTGAFEWRSKISEESQFRSGGGADTLATLKEVRSVAWLQDEWQLAEQHVLTPGLRYQVLENQVTDSVSGEVQKTHRSLDPSLHYLWQLTDEWNLRASIAQNSKVPSTRDLSPLVRQSTGANSSSNPDRGGNAQLEPERLRSIEMGVEHFLPDRAGTIGFSLFDREIDNYIQRLMEDDGGRWVERPRNVGKAQLQGGLFDFKSRMAVINLPNLTLRGNLAYTSIRMLEQIAGLGAGEGPRKSANIGWDYEWSAYRLTFGGNYNYVSALDRESSATIRQLQGGRKQLDLYALYKLDKQTAIRVSAQNVTREDRTNSLQELDSNGQLQRVENDLSPGVATYFVTLETKW